MIELFKIRRKERWMSLVVLLVLTALNSLTIIRYHEQFSKLCDNYGNLFIKTFHVSGFDPLTYVVVSNWHTSYNVYRHPLLAFFMYPANESPIFNIPIYSHYVSCIQHFVIFIDINIY